MAALRTHPTVHRSAPSHRGHEASLDAAFASACLKDICRAVDTALCCTGRIVDVARAAECDRTTLYRAFRRERGPQLSTMTRVLRALGLQLIVVPHGGTVGGSHGEGPVRCGPRPDRRAAESARRFSLAIEEGKLETLFDAFTHALGKYETVAAFARKSKMRRESLYRVFCRDPNPRFGTLVDILNSLGLRFAVRSMVPLPRHEVNRRFPLPLLTTEQERFLIEIP